MQKWMGACDCIITKVYDLFHLSSLSNIQITIIGKL